MAAMFHVFVEGPTDGSPAGVRRLAEAIAQSYGLPAAELTTRLAAGRFRVKGNVDRATADNFLHDLQQLGARCVIEPATAAVMPPPRTAPPVPRAPAPPKPSGPPAAGAYQSGLSAAFSGQMPAANLGALEGDGGAFSLSSVDGNDAAAPAPASFEPPPSASVAKSAPKANSPPNAAPLDMFAPPDAADSEIKMELASDEIERTSARMRASTPPEVPVSAPPAAPRAVITRPVAETREGAGLLGDPRKRFIAGVVLAIALGFIPAHLLASSRERSAFSTIDANLVALQQEAETPEAYASLDTIRADQLDRKHGERRNIAMISLFVWALVGGGLAYVWFRRIPWDRFDDA